MAQISYGTITITDTTDIDQIVNYYLATSASSGVTRSTSGWTTTVQSMTSTKQYLWNYEKIMGTGDVLIHQTDPVIIGRYGQNGTNGVDGNSITSIDEYYQATNSTTNPGSSGWSTSIVNPTSSNKYLWNYQVINYSKTASEGTYADARIIGVYGDKGDPGTNGTNGINTATVYLYQRATSAPSKPSSTLTYTFSTAALTPTSSLGSWKQNIGDLTGTNPIWVIAAVASSNGTSDTIASTEWSTQVKMAQNGTDGQPGAAGAAGLNQATVYIYKRGDSAGTISPATATYTFSNGSFTAPTNWSKTIPSTPAGKPCWVSTAVAIGNESTATLTWNTPSVLVEDGTDGISPTVTSTSTGVKIVDAAGNETYINNGSNGQSYYTYIRYATDSSGSNMSSSPSGKTYIGVYSGTASSAPTTANSYTWSKYVGDPGTPATQYYAFVKYATDANGSNMQDSPDSTHIYVGTYTGTNASPAASAYQWSKYVGADGQSATQYYAFIRYATSSTGANMTDTPTASTTYVGTYSGTKSSPVASDYKWSVYVGTDGISVTQVRELYYLTTGNAPSKPTASTDIYDDDRVGYWTSILPSYIVNGKYYLSLETTLSNNAKTFSDVILDEATTTANENAYLALSISQNANENAQGAMSQSTAAQILAEGLQTKLKYMWVNEINYVDYPAGSYMASGNNSTFDYTNPATYGFNSFLEHTKLHFRYNAIDLDTLGLDGLKLYAPVISNNVITGSQLGVELTSSALKFYRPGAANPTIDAQLDTNGLRITNGSIVLGTTDGTTAGNVTLSNVDFSRSINGTSRNYLRLAIGGNFGVKNDGTLYASNADISGTLTAGANSKIGPWNVTDSSIWYGNSTFGNANGIYLGTGGLSLGSAFQVTNAGALTATNANVEGTITATSGSLDSLIATNLTINSGSIANNVTIGGKSQADYLNSNINIGGKNLLRCTGDYYECSLPTDPAIYYNWADNGEAQICKYSAYTGDLVWDAVTFRPFISYSAVRGKMVTLSFWYQSDSWSNNDGGHNYLIPSFGLYTAHRGVSRHKWYSDYSGTAIPTTSWKKYEITLEVTDVLFNSGEGTISTNDLFTLQLYRHNKSVVQIKKVKLEIGNKATDWTPAPEDLQSVTGENILMDTNASSLDTVAAPAARYFSDSGQTNVDPSIVSITDAPISGVSYGAKFITTLQSGMTTGRCLAFYSSNGIKLTRRRVYTLSCWAKGTGKIRFQVGNGTPYINNASNGAYAGVANYELSSSGWVKVQWSFYYDNQWNGTYPIIYYGVYGDTAGTVYLCGFKLEEGNAAASWAMNTTEAGKTASNYITEIDTRKGITIKPVDSSGNDYVQLNSSDLRFVRNGNARTIIQDDWMCLGDSGGARITLSTTSNNPYIYMGDENNVQMFHASSSGVTIGSAGSGHSVVKSDGLHIWTGSESTSTNEVAQFCSTARIGSTASYNVYIDTTGVAFRSGTTDKMKITTAISGNYVNTDLTSKTSYSQSRLQTAVANNSSASGHAVAQLNASSTSGGAPSGTITAMRTSTEGFASVTAQYSSTVQAYLSLDAVSGSATAALGASGGISLLGNTTISGSLKVLNHSSAIGTIKEAYLSEAKKVPTGTTTGTPLCSISLEAGTWIITAGVRAPANNTGVRIANISTTSGDASLVVNQQAVQGANTQMRFVIATVATATTTYYLNAMQNSGSELNYPAGGSGWGNFLRAVRIA